MKATGSLARSRDDSAGLSIRANEPCFPLSLITSWCAGQGWASRCDHTPSAERPLPGTTQWLFRNDRPKTDTSERQRVCPGNVTGPPAFGRAAKTSVRGVSTNVENGLIPSRRIKGVSPTGSPPLFATP